jgi:uncharacterized sulfatase
VELLDLYPTLVDVCGLQSAPGNLQGRSLQPLLANPDAPWDKPAISQVRRGNGEKQVMGYSLRTERYRYSAWGQHGKLGDELYDYQADPREVRNISTDPKASALKAKLRDRLEAIVKTRPPVHG